MASGWYAPGMKHFAKGDVKWLLAAGSTIKATMIDSADYTANLTTDEYMNTNTVPAAAKVRVSSAMTLVDAADGGVLDATDVVETAVTGDSVEAVIVWLDGGDGGTTAAGTVSFLLGYLEASVTPNGGNITIQWGNVAGLLLGKL